MSFRAKRTPTLFLLALIAALILNALPTHAPSAAQSGAGAGLTNFVLLRFSNYVGVSPPLTAPELELGDLNRPFSASYRFNGLDLTTAPLSCDSRVMDDDEIITNGRVGYRYLITLQRRIYEFRTNLTGSQLIRCYFGEPIDFNGNPRGIGTTLSGEQAVNVAMRHAQGYLGLDQTITVELANNPNENTPRTFYQWFPWVYLDESLLCPARGFTYDVRDTFAFRVLLTINGRFLDYRVRGDGNVVLLCQGGRPNDASIGLTIDRFGDEANTTTN
jgi:hypothetical protein